MERLVFINDELIPESSASLSIFDVGRLYGATFYESIRTFRHKCFKLKEHLERLECSLRYSGILEHFSMKRAETAIQKVLDANIALTEKDDDIWICVEVTPGTTFPMPLMKQAETTPTVIAYSNRLPFSEYAKYYTQGKHIVTSLHRNVPPQCFEQRCKNRSRLTHFLSKQQALKKDQDAFAMMLDCDGYITETTGANIFFVKDDILYTSTTNNILNGISRQFVIALAKKSGTRVVEKNLTLYDAYNADEAFLTTSSYCILPVSSIDEKKTGDNYPGPSAKKLLDRWSEEAGVDIIGQALKFAGEK